jgi:hypothetical protein
MVMAKRRADGTNTADAYIAVVAGGDRTAMNRLVVDYFLPILI